MDISRIPNSDTVSGQKFSPGSLSHTPFLRIDEKTSSNVHTTTPPRYDDVGKNTSVEKKKKALRGSPNCSRLWVWWTIVLQLLPVTITIVIYWLNLTKHYLWDFDAAALKFFNDKPITISSVEFFNTLQLVAKVHELLAVASLSVIVMHMAMSFLVRREGLSYGLLTSHLEVGSIGFVFSTRFWAVLGNRQTLFALFVLCCTILASLIGPASGVGLVLSQPDWWPVKSPYGRLPDMPVYLDASDRDLWPSVVSAEQMSKAQRRYCSSANYTNIDCPGGGFQELFDWSLAFGVSSASANITMKEPVASTSRILSSTLWHFEDSELSLSVAAANTLTAATCRVLGSFYRWIETNSIGIAHRTARPRYQTVGKTQLLQPNVLVGCHSYDYREAVAGTKPHSTPMFFQDFLFRNSSFPVPQAYWNYTRDFNSLRTTNFTWFSTSEHNLSLSLGAVITAPYMSHPPELNEPVPKNAVQESMIITCSINARWIGAEMTMYPKDNDIVWNNVKSAVLTPYYREEAPPPVPVGPMITIEKEWADYMNAPHVDGGSYSMIQAILIPYMAGYDIYKSAAHQDNTGWYNFGNFTSFVPQQLAQSPQDLLRDSANLLATITSLVVADGLARLHYISATYIVTGNQQHHEFQVQSLLATSGLTRFVATSASRAGLSTLMPIFVDLHRFGYSYGKLGSRTMQFALAVLGIHGVITMVFVSYLIFISLCRYKVVGVKSWGSMSQLGALLLCSKMPEQLRNAGAGVGDTSTWKKQVRIRAVSTDDGSRGESYNNESISYGAQDLFSDFDKVEVLFEGDARSTQCIPLQNKQKYG